MTNDFLSNLRKRVDAMSKVAVPQKISELTPNQIHQCNLLFFRQSFLNDWLTCPQMALYRWVLFQEDLPSFFSALMGTAGHEVIYTMHTMRKYNYKESQLFEMFHENFLEAVRRDENPPPPGAKFDSLEDEFVAKAEPYIEMLDGYQRHDTTSQFISTMHEQQFVLLIKPNEIYPELPEWWPPFLFTGTIDQWGYGADTGNGLLRDMKFRDNALRPSYWQLDLDLQMTLYVKAIKDGYPACSKCKPRYIDDESAKADPSGLYSSGIQKLLVYNGPCDKCKDLIGTPQWPQVWTHECHLIWMQDFRKYKTNQYAETIKDKSRKVKAATSNRMVYPEIPNPKFDDGYKKGDYRGEGIIKTARPPSKIAILLPEILRAAEMIRQGIFFRRPGPHCMSFCRFRTQCLDSLNMAGDDYVMEHASAFASDDDDLVHGMLDQFLDNKIGDD